MAAGVSTPENGAVAFDMQHLGCLVQLTITIPQPSTVNKVTLLSDGEFIQNGTINLTSDEIAISPTSVSNTFDIEIETVQTTSEDENIIVYFMLPPTNLSSNTLKVQIATESNENLEYSLPTRNFVAGKIYALNASKEDVVITGTSSNITISKASLKTFVNIPTDVTVYQVGVYVSLEEIPTDSNGTTLVTSEDSNMETTEFSFQATNMVMKTTYYYRSFVYIPLQAKYYFGEILKFTTQNIDEVTPGEYIDLGLSVKWASHNMGAESQEQIGDRYAWGELTPYSGNYSYESNGSMIDIGNNICGTYYDVAYVRLGDNWRLPTYREMTELFTNSSYVFTSYKGVIGYLVQGPNGNSIFIPYGNTNFYSGWHTDETGYSYDTYGYFAGFMTGELSTKSGNKGRVYSLMFTDAGTSKFLWYVNGTLSRSVGQSVRPVYTK
jgi:hypothetical protein